jgi:hypothetical protein
MHKSYEIVETIKRKIGRLDARFVFPSAVIREQWAQYAASLPNVHSVALERFIVWDDFTRTLVHATVANRKPIDNTLRALFVESVIRDNAVAPFLKAVIPEAYAAGGHVFAAAIARVLPSLQRLSSIENSAHSTNNYNPDAEDADFHTLKALYQKFLDDNALFESAWEQPPFRDNQHDYYLFFTETLAEFAEYEQPLSAAANVHIIPTEDADEMPVLKRYRTFREEIRATVLDIVRLNREKGIDYDQMAITVADINDVLPYLQRELYLYDVPYRARAGRPLADYGVGRMAGLLGACSANHYSFATLKALLFNQYVPWRYPERNIALIRFGVENNCVAGYEDDTDRRGQHDVWKDALWKNKELQEYYSLLKRRIDALVSAKSFLKMREAYHAFNRDFLAPYEGETGAVLMLCATELSKLVALEREYPSVKARSPWQFYLEVLTRRIYAPTTDEVGRVSIFQWQVAAGAPFRCHFVLGVNQHAAQVVHNDLPFLRQDKRRALSLREIDRSALFFALYSRNYGDGMTRLSYSEEAVSGWAIAHSYFTGREQEGVLPSADAYRAETLWWRGESAFPTALHTPQKRGLSAWKTRREAATKAPFSLFHASYSPTLQPFADFLAGGTLNVSATQDLDDYYQCAVKWLYKRLFKVKAEDMDAKLLDDEGKGLLYHEILHVFFERIHNEEPGAAFHAAHCETYSKWLDEAAREVCDGYRAFQGPLAAPLLGAMAHSLAMRLRRLLPVEAANFEGCTPQALEIPLKLERNGLIINGRSDRISMSDDSRHCIIDYKPNATPAIKECWRKDDKPPSKFQIALYIILTEAQTMVPVDDAAYISITQAKVSPVVNSESKNGRTRSDYGNTIQTVNTMIDNFAAKVKALDFTACGNYDDCGSCDFKAVCRRTYAIGKTQGDIIE